MLYKKFLEIFGSRINITRKLFSTTQNVQLLDQKTVTETSKSNSKTKSKSRVLTVSTEIRNHLKDCNAEYLIDHIPKKLLQRVCKPSSKIYLINHDTVKELSSMISKHLLKNSSYVIECNPGLGLLTKELLNNGIPLINLYEKSEFVEPNSPLLKLLAEHPNRLHLKQLNFFLIWMTLLHDKFYNETLAEEYLIDVPRHPWKKNTFAQIIALCPSRNFMSLLIHNFFNQTAIFDHGRPAIFLVIPFHSWMRLTMDNENFSLNRYYMPYNVILHLFFKYEQLGELPRRSFVPWPKAKTKKGVDELNSPMIVLKIEPKRNIDSKIEKENLRAFWFFLKFGMRSRKLKVIMELEKLVPGCGPRLILHDFDICSSFKELPPIRLLELFKLFKSWPEYDENLFIPSMESAEEIKKEEIEKLEVDEEQEQEPTDSINLASDEKQKPEAAIDNSNIDCRSQEN